MGTVGGESATMTRFDRRTLLAGAAALLLPACGDEPPAKPGDDGVVPLQREPAGQVFVQDAWIPYDHPDHKPGRGYTLPAKDMTWERATDAAAEARARCQAGQDIGYVAWLYSSLPWGYLGGYSALPVDPRQPAVRFAEARKLAVGALSEVFEWQRGFWFCRRIDKDRARRLEQRVQMADRIRAKARVIHYHHAGADPRRMEFDGVTQERALAFARTAILKVQGGQDFAQLAESTGNDLATRRRGGRMQWTPPGARTPTDWMQWRARRAYHYHLYEAIFENAPVGRVNPEPIISPMGIDVVYVEARQVR